VDENCALAVGVTKKQKTKNKKPKTKNHEAIDLSFIGQPNLSMG